MFQLISAPETRTNPSATRQFLVQFVSKSDRKVVDVCLMEQTRDTIDYSFIKKYCKLVAFN